jgi:serine-type D-Ala-D-Ala carboxypeptidase/endopeptidase
MHKLNKPLLLILVIGLTSCALIGTAVPPVPSPIITNTPISSTAGTLAATPTETAADGSPTPTSAATMTDEPPSPTSTPGIQTLTDDELKAQLDRLSAIFLKNTRNPALSLAVVLRDPVSGQLQVMVLNYGTVFKDGGTAVDSDTVYELGSITKLFTGILLAEAVNDGEVKLADPIQAYMPTGIQAPVYKDIPITLVNLATHHSGLPRDLNTDNISDVYAWLNNYQPSIAPGSEYIYSNLAYGILGDILARNANSDFGTLVYNSVSQPLGLLDTTEALTDDQRSRLAKGYGYDGTPTQYEPESGARGSAGYMHSTLNDMTRFLIENMQPDSTPLSLSLELAQTMQSVGMNPKAGTGLGWEIDYPGKPYERLWKGGATYGFSSYISFVKDDSSGFILLTNGQYIDHLALPIERLLNELH